MEQLLCFLERYCLASEILSIKTNTMLFNYVQQYGFFLLNNSPSHPRTPIANPLFHQHKLCISLYFFHSSCPSDHSSTRTIYTCISIRLTSTINHQPSTVNPQPSTINRQPSTVNRQPSTINHQPLTINRQPSTINHNYFCHIINITRHII